MKNSVSKHLISLLTATILALCLTIPAFAHSTPDIKEHWAAKEIGEWLHNGYVSTYDDGSFKPDAPITRAEFVAIINKAFHYTEKKDIAFSDVDGHDPSADDFSIASAAGYINGYEDGTIRPNAAITRLEAAAVISKIAKLDAAGHEKIHAFKDYADIAKWGVGYANAAIGSGCLTGYPDSTFRPGRTITRAEAVVTLYRVAAAAAGAGSDIGTGSSSGEYNAAGGHGAANENNKTTGIPASDSAAPEIGSSSGHDATGHSESGK